jgi:hypothetical protein
MPTPESIASYWKVLLPIVSFAVGTSIVIFDVIIDPPVDSTTSIIGVVIAGFGPALRDVIGKG